MRFACFPFVIFAASFSLAAAQSASIHPPVDPIKIDLMQRPAPVYVLNFPEVQPVSGTVSVDNLPAVQTVGGTVNIGNLPLDDAGAVRVGSGPARQPVLLELLSGPLTLNPGTTFVSQPVDTTGYSQLGLRFEGNYYNVSTEWRWKDDDSFGPVNDARNGNDPLCQVGNPNYRRICAVSGVEVRLVTTNTAQVPIHYSSLKVYLIP
jgi:hypothetical protein